MSVVEPTHCVCIHYSIILALGLFCLGIEVEISMLYININYISLVGFFGVLAQVLSCIK